MTSNKGNLITSIVLLIVGALFAALSGNANFTRWLVLLCGLTFVVPAAISLLGVFFPPKDASPGMLPRILQLICGLGGLCLGLCIIFMPDVFRSLLFYPFGALLILVGLLQEYQITSTYRPVAYPWWIHVAPVALIVAGTLLLCVPGLHELSAERWMVLMVGIGGILSGLNGMIYYGMARRYYRNAKLARRAAAVAVSTPSPNATTNATDSKALAASDSAAAADTSQEAVRQQGDTSKSNDTPILP